MSVTSTLENGGEGILYIHSGIVSGDELTDKTRDHYARFDTERLRYQIMDFSAVDRIEIGTDQMKETARMFCEKLKTRRADHKFAIVISNDPMMAVLKMWSNYFIDPEVHGKIFDSMDKAREWINEDIQTSHSTG